MGITRQRGWQCSAFSDVVAPDVFPKIEIFPLELRTTGQKQGSQMLDVQDNVACLGTSSSVSYLGYWQHCQYGVSTQGHLKEFVSNRGFKLKCYDLSSLNP